MKQIVISLTLVLVSAFYARTVANSAPKVSNDTIIVLTVAPAMHCENCENKIKKNIRFERGVKEIKVDRENQTITIKADKSKTTIGKLSKAFAKIGYKTTEVK